MFLREKTKKRGAKVYTYYQLVESYYTPRGPRQRVVVSLGDLSPRPRDEWLKLVRQVEAALSGQMDLTVEEVGEEAHAIAERVRRKRKEAIQPKEEDDVVSIHLNGVRTTKPRELGPAYVGVTFWERLGLDEILKGCGLSAKACQRVKLMTVNALCDSESEYATPDWMRRTAIGDLVGLGLESVSESALYRTLDTIWGEREGIEQALAGRETDLFELDNAILLYDLTATYFEGEMRRNGAAKRGYSPDRRGDCKQVVLGLILDSEGFVKGHEVFDGNRCGSTTLKEMVALLDGRTGKQKGTVVMDRGLAARENLEWLRGEDRTYLVAVRSGERDAWKQQLGEGGWEEVIRPGPPSQPNKKRPRVEVKREEKEKEAYILCRSEGRKAKDAAIRERFAERMEKDLEKLRKRIASGRLEQIEKIHEKIGRLRERYPRVARLYDITVVVENDGPRLEWSSREEARREVEELDGTYVLRTNRLDWSAEEVWKIYIMLTHVEATFRSLKTTLSLRPIRHHRQDRGEAHIFLCILAYHLVHAVEMTLRAHGEYRTWRTLRKQLRSHQVNTVVLPASNGDVYEIRKPSTPEPHQREIYRKLEMDPEVKRYPSRKRKRKA